MRFLGRCSGVTAGPLGSSGSGVSLDVRSITAESSDGLVAEGIEAEGPEGSAGGGFNVADFAGVDMLPVANRLGLQ